MVLLIILQNCIIKSNFFPNLNINRVIKVVIFLTNAVPKLNQMHRDKHTKGNKFLVHSNYKIHISFSHIHHLNHTKLKNLLKFHGYSNITFLSCIFFNGFYHFLHTRLFINVKKSSSEENCFHDKKK